MKSQDEGWGRPGLSRKFHYFKNMESLCGKWMYRPSWGYEPDDGKADKDDCSSCRKKLEPKPQSVTV
jgi:hypothetical protein